MPRAVSVGSSKPVPKRKKPRKSLRQMVMEEYSNLMRHSGHSNNSISSAGGVTATSKRRKRPIGEYNMNDFTNWFTGMRKKRKKEENAQKQQNKKYIVVNGVRRYGNTSRVSGSPGGSSVSTGGTWRHSTAKK